VSTLADLLVKIGVDNSGVDKGSKQTESKFSRLWGRVQATAAIAGAAIGAAAVAGIAKAMELDKAQARLTAQLGDPALAAQLGKVAGDVYARGFGESAAAAMESVQAVVSSGLAPAGDAAVIEDLTVKVQAYADAWGTDVADAAQYASTLIGSGLARDATHAMDLITVASQRVPAALREDVLEAGDEYAQFFRTLGFSGEQAFGVLVQAASKGQYGIDKAGDAIKEFTLRATDMSTTSVEAYKAIGLDAEQMSNKILAGGATAQTAFQQIISGLLSIQDPTERANTAISLFGTPLEDLNVADIPEFLKGLQAAGGGLGDVTGAAAKAGDALENSASQKLDQFKRKAEQALVVTLEKAVPYIEKTFGWLSRNSGWVTPLATGLGILATAIGAIVLAMKVWAAVQLVLNLALWTSPITWIVLAVIALVAAIVWVATQTTWFETIWNAVWGAVKAAFQFVVNWIVNGWKWAIGLVVAGVKTWWSIFTGFWSWVGQKAADTVRWITDKFGKLVDFVKGLPSRISRAASGMWDGIKRAFRSTLNWLIARWNNFSLTLGGGSVLGIDIPSVTLSTPDIPMLADGGIVPATPGGRLAVIGEGRHDEAVVPLPRGARDLGRLGGGERTVIELRSGGSALDDVLVEVLRRAIRVRGGDVQLVLGR